MARGSDSREFFEIFKPPQKVEDVQKKEIKPQTEPAVASPQPGTLTPDEKPVTKPILKADPLGWIKKTCTEETTVKGKSGETRPFSAPPKEERILRKDEVILRQETLIIGAIAATFLSIACFFVGHKVGYNKGIMSQAEEWLETIEPEPQDTKRTPFGQPKSVEVPQKLTSKASPIKSEKQTEQPKPIIKDKWTLRVISYKNTKENIERAKAIAKAIQNTLGYDAFIVNTGKEIFICVGEFEESNHPDLIAAQKTLTEFKYENKKQFVECYPVRMR
jgi:hypothetical protein